MVQLPKELLDSLQNLPGFDLSEFVRVHASGEQITSVRLNPAKTSHIPPDAERVPWCSNGYYLPQRPSFTFDPLFHAGTYYVQEASSMFLEEVMKQTVDLAQPLLVLDLCAAPGGKSTLLQSVLSNESLLISNEVIQSRVAVLKENISKWGSDNVVLTNNDSRDFGKLKGLFDVLVVDAPCSGSGLFRRDADAVQEWSEANVHLCCGRQQRILADAWPCLKEGGILIYSTCSYSREEDEEIVDWLLQNFNVEGLRLSVPELWQIQQVQSKEGNWGYRFWPNKVKGEGFFISAFQKIEPVDPVKVKTKSVQLPSKPDAAIAQCWLQQPQRYSLVMQGQHIAAVPSRWEAEIQYFMQELKVRYAGVELGTIAKNNLVPEHALALSTIIQQDIYAVDLNEDEAIRYLRKNDFQLTDSYKGWSLARYKGHNLGWIKLLGNRINNYYPKEYRILK